MAELLIDKAVLLANKVDTLYEQNKMRHYRPYGLDKSDPSSWQLDFHQSGIYDAF